MMSQNRVLMTNGISYLHEYEHGTVMNVIRYLHEYEQGTVNKVRKALFEVHACTFKTRLFHEC